MFNKLILIYGKALILFLPLLSIMASFIIIDPFGIIHSDNPKYEGSDDYYATELYLRNTKKIAYNAFVFGNSKSMAFLSTDWKKYVKDGVFFKFGVPGESIYNVYNKINLIDEKGDSLKNVILVLDAAMILNWKNTSSHLQGPVYKHHPLTQGESWLTFYAAFFKYYLSDFFFLNVIKEGLFSKEAKTKGNDFLQTKKVFNSNTNEFFLSDVENEIQNQGYLNYYKKHELEFKTPSSQTDSHNKIELHELDKQYLKEMKLLFEKHKCNYKIIIGPVWKNNPMPIEVKEELERICGKDRVFDFSDFEMINNDSTYFYERSHYRPIAGNLILNKIYSINDTSKVCERK